MNEFTIFQNALGEVFESELNDFFAGIDLEQPHTFSDKFNRRMSKLIKRREKSYYILISTAGRRAACIILMIVMLSASTLTVKAVRDAVYDFIMRIFGDHTEVSVENVISNEYPKTIEEEYYISDLPKGFEIKDDRKTDKRHFILYEDGKNFILFNQYTMDHYKKLYDNEYSGYEKLFDNNTEYLVQYSNSDDTFAFIWNNSKYVFEIRSNLSEKSVEKLCKSTKIKK